MVWASFLIAATGLTQGGGLRKMAAVEM